MTARHWMQIAALTSALGVTGGAIAQGAGQATSPDARSSVSSYGMDAPSSGAIITPADKAAGMGKGGEQARRWNRDFNGDTSASTTSNDDASGANPGTSNDENLSVTPPSKDGEVGIDRRGAGTNDDAARHRAPKQHDSASMPGDNRSAPARTGSDVRPGDMGPGDMRGE